MTTIPETEEGSVTFSAEAADLITDLAYKFERALARLAESKARSRTGASSRVDIEVADVRAAMRESIEEALGEAHSLTVEPKEKVSA